MSNPLLPTVALSCCLLAAGCSRPGTDKPVEPQSLKVQAPEPATADTRALTTAATPAGPPPGEQEVLKNLEVYKAKHELDKDSHVVRVVLEGKAVTDEALAEVARLPNLKRLSLARSSITDAGLLHLKDMVWLESLGITDTAVTDQGLKYLEKMPSLRYIWVCENDKLTKEGIDSLRQALLGVHVYVMNQPATTAPHPKKDRQK